MPFYFEQRATAVETMAESDFSPDGRLGKHQVFVAARALSLSAVIVHLNALVDDVLLTLASRVLPPEWAMTSSAMSRSRKQLLDAIEHRYGVDVTRLPGWSRIEAVREDANSLKHRGGMSLPEATPLGIPVTRGVELDVEVLGWTIEEVRSWLLALWDATEGAKPSNAV